MKRQINLRNSAGKTIAIVVEGYNDVVISFTDDTFAFLHPKIGYDDADIEEPDYFRRWHSNEISTEAVVAAGVLSQDEANELTRRKMAEHEELTAATERQQYLRLKEKFEGTAVTVDAGK